MNLPAVPSPPWLDTAAYPFTARAVAVDEGSMHYVDEGEGDVVLLVHGTPTWSYEYRRLIAALRPRYRVIALDHLGFGLSERPRGADYSPEGHARRFAGFVEALGLGRFSLVTHDFGGPIALPFAAAQPGRIASLALFNTWMWPLGDDPALRRQLRIAGGAVGRFLYKWGNASLRVLMPAAFGDRRALTPELHRQYLAPFVDREARVQVLHALARSLLGSREHFAGLYARRGALASIPTTVIWGLADAALGPPQIERLRRALPAAEVHALAGVGHWPHEEAPAEVAARLEAHLARALARGGARSSPLA